MSILTKFSYACALIFLNPFSGFLKFFVRLKILSKFYALISPPQTRIIFAYFLFAAAPGSVKIGASAATTIICLQHG